LLRNSGRQALQGVKFAAHVAGFDEVSFRFSSEAFARAAATHLRCAFQEDCADDSRPAYNRGKP
jgi:hypothetical protein